MTEAQVLRYSDDSLSRQ
uniref:Uncharacterized protein n=1 Tax=Rhizophora mucronata TaxID=61149 RepID=A0A2P2IVL5_RHIMU